MDIGKEIRALRIEKELTQAQVCRDLMTIRELSRIENCVNQPSYYVLNKILKKTGTDLSTFSSYICSISEEYFDIIRLKKYKLFPSSNELYKEKMNKQLYIFYLLAISYSITEDKISCKKMLQNCINYISIDKSGFKQYLICLLNFLNEEDISSNAISDTELYSLATFNVLLTRKFLNKGDVFNIIKRIFKIIKKARYVSSEDLINTISIISFFNNYDRKITGKIEMNFINDFKSRESIKIIKWLFISIPEDIESIVIENHYVG